MQSWSVKTDVYYGQGALDRLASISNKRVLVVTDSFMTTSGTADKVASHLTNCEVKIFDKVVPDPPINVVSEGVKCLHEFGTEFIVALGGGSSIDSAKAIRTIAQESVGSKASDIPLVAIPTTSGTGSEVTNYAVISNPEKGAKYPLSGDHLLASEAILDPELTLSVPPAITADTGLDALTHAIEAYVSTGAGDFTDAWCEKAVQLIFEYLPSAFRGGDTPEAVKAREKMSNAATLAGLAFNIAGLGVNHGIAHAVGARFHLPHGRACQLLLAPVMAFNADLGNVRNGEYSVAAQKYAHLAKVLGFSSASIRIGASNMIREVDRLCRTVGEPATLRQCGVDSAEARVSIPELAAKAVVDPTTSTNPRPISEEQVVEILKKLV
ncbi:1-propanol dehydrogenase PduQ [Paratractidigestivibacter sp.]|uniref:1-propanol dehydrogenase PduQ n=1 Tax=Paratractidigestivibacter sp. TaxID=2847316 RepID=UPI002ABDDD39|nr:1-propanol dehydrogenase PduQ [Paratractidigestivibacter sp.]